MTIAIGEATRAPNVLLKTYKQILATLLSCLLSICAGQAFGHSATLLPQLRSDKDFPFDEKYSSWIAAITPLSMILGCLLAGTIVEALGRKAGHVGLSFFFLFSWLMLAFATDNIFLLIGRFLSGVAAGALRPITYVYLGEIMDPKYRSLALMCPSMSLCVGVLINHTLGGYVHWRMSCFISCGPSAICGILALFIKESPLWLISKGRTQQGIKVFKWFRGEGDAAIQELNEILNRQKDKINKSMFKEFFQVQYIKPIFLAMMVAVSTQVCGINVLSFYAQEMLEKTFPGKIDSFSTMLTLDCVRLITSTVIFFLGKVLPRRPSFLFFNFGTVASLTLLVTYLYVNPDNLMWLSIVLIILYTCLGSGVVSLGWSYVPELFPAALRGFGSGFVSAITFFLLFVNIKVTPGIMETFGEISMYIVYGVLTLANAILLCFILPETNGRSLQEIENSYIKEKSNIIISKL